MAEWSKAPDSSSGLRERAWVQIPLLTLNSLFGNGELWFSNAASLAVIFAFSLFSRRSRGRTMVFCSFFSYIPRPQSICIFAWSLKNCAVTDHSTFLANTIPPCYIKTVLTYFNLHYMTCSPCKNDPDIRLMLGFEKQSSLYQV